MTETQTAPQQDQPNRDPETWQGEDPYDAIREIQQPREAQPQPTEPTAEDNFTQEAAQRATRLRITPRGTAVAAGAALLAGSALAVGGTEAVKAAVEHFEQEVVASEQLTVSAGQSVSGLVESAIPGLALEAGIDPTAIPKDLILSEASQAAGEMKAMNGDEKNQPGETYTIEILLNKAGQVGLNVDPFVQLPTLPGEEQN